MLPTGFGRIDTANAAYSVELFTARTFERGGYETQLAYQSRLVPDAGELLTKAALAVLDRLFAST